MNPKTISRSIIAVVIALLIAFALKWHNDTVEDVKREAIAINEGIIKEKQAQLDSLKKEGLKLKHISDSLMSSINYKDTIEIRKRYEVKINNVRRLNADSTIAILAKHISK